MPKVKEHDIDVRNNRVQEYEAGKGYRKFLKQFSIPLSSVQSIIKERKEQGIATNRPRTVAPKKKNKV